MYPETLYDIGDLVFDYTEGKCGIIKDFDNVEFDPNFPTAHCGIEYIIKYQDGEEGRANETDVFIVKVREQSTEIVYSLEVEELNFEARLTYTEGETPYGTEPWDFEIYEDDEKIFTDELREAIIEQCMD
jgi:hypothetical protein|tara:strand:+ start:4679 stop:5068 length:390 start_codon:yes stop_codon:yes gene_type:complete